MEQPRLGGEAPADPLDVGVGGWANPHFLICAEKIHQTPEKMCILYMEVSLIGGIPQWMVDNGRILLNWMTKGDPYFRKPPDSV